MMYVGGREKYRSGSELEVAETIRVSLERHVERAMKTQANAAG